MSSTRRQLLAATISTCCLVGLGSLLFARAENGRPQGTKMVYVDAHYRVDPVAIVKVTVGGETVHPGLSTGAREDRPGTPFQADDDWIKNMSITLKNRTNKVIVRSEIIVYFLASSASQSVGSYTITLGERPESASFTSTGKKLPPESKQPLSILPSQVQVIHFADFLDGMQAVVEQNVPFSQVTRVALLRLQFYFSDGMRWNDLAGFGIPDPDHPGQFKNMDRQTFFPGDTHQNWPPNEFWIPPGRKDNER